MIEISPYSVLWTYIITIIYVFLISVIIKVTNKTKAALLPITLSMPVTLIILFHILAPIELIPISKTYTDYKVFPLIVDFLLYPLLNIKGKTVLNTLSLLLIAWGIKVLYESRTPVGKIHSIILSGKRIAETDSHKLEVLNYIKNKYNFNFKTKLICDNKVNEISEFGFFHQIIYIDEYDYTDKELQYIFLHELTHFKYGTNWLKMLLFIVSMIFCWIPGSDYYAEYFNDCIEAFVDKKAVSKLSEREKFEYCKCLLTVFSNLKPAKYKENALITSFISRDEKMIDCRIKTILNNTKEAKKYKVNIPMCLSITLLTVVYVFVSYNYIIQPGWKPPSESTSNHNPSEFNNSDSYIVLQDNKYILYVNGEPFAEVDDLQNYPDVPLIQPQD